MSGGSCIMLRADFCYYVCIMERIASDLSDQAKLLLVHQKKDRLVPSTGRKLVLHCQTFITPFFIHFTLSYSKKLIVNSSVMKSGHNVPIASSTQFHAIILVLPSQVLLALPASISHLLHPPALLKIYQIMYQAHYQINYPALIHRTSICST
jgi:hypothetical protein